MREDVIVAAGAGPLGGIVAGLTARAGKGADHAADLATRLEVVAIKLLGASFASGEMVQEPFMGEMGVMRYNLGELEFQHARLEAALVELERL